MTIGIALQTKVYSCVLSIVLSILCFVCSVLGRLTLDDIKTVVREEIQQRVPERPRTQRQCIKRCNKIPPKTPKYNVY